MSLVQAERLEKRYRLGEGEVPAIRGVDFTIEAGAFVAFVGPFGQRQVHAAQLGRLPRPSQRWAA